MRVQMRGLVRVLILSVAVIIIASCGDVNAGTVPRGTPDRGNGTLAVIPTPTAQSISNAILHTKNANYAFVRENQLWVATSGADPVQMTHFDYSGVPDVFWHFPLWSSDDHYIAFIMNAHPTGLGGGGCPGPDYTANGSLHLLNMVTGQLTKLTVSADSSDAIAASEHDGHWQYAFWEDATHLLAWYNGIPGKNNTNAGLYRFDLSSGTLSLVLSLSSLGVGTLFSVQNNLPLMLSMRYSNGQLFYQVIVHPFEPDSQILIYRRPIRQPESSGSEVLEMGKEPWCTAQNSGSFVKPGWDISPDGTQLVAQVVKGTGSADGGIQETNLKSGSTIALFAQAPVSMLDSDLMLAWGPNSRVVVATTYHSSVGPYSTIIDNPGLMLKYTPNLTGVVSWRSDSSVFVLQNADTPDDANATDLYMFASNDANGKILLTNAQNFVWG